MSFYKHTTALVLLFSFNIAFAHGPSHEGPVTVLIDKKVAEVFSLPIESESELAGVVQTTLSPEMAETISQYQHASGRCGGYQVIEELDETPFAALEYRANLETTYLSVIRPLSLNSVPADLSVKSAIDKVDAGQIRSFVEWFSSYPDRHHRGSNPNQSILALKQRIQTMMAKTNLNWTVDEISHNSTPQKSLRVSIPGNKNPEQYIVLGGHADSINQWGMLNPKAPGADDNASGSGALFEALRVLAVEGQQPQRTIEFFWYAGEESGLLGSGEIAASYKNAGKDVVAVLQLDMTAYPGRGSNTIGNIADFTSAWLRDYLVQINATYLGLTIVKDECGYACSDHASWHRQGFPALMPFEADTRTMNKNIHTDRDVTSILDFNHASHFAKIAVIFAMDLGNSTQREPIQ